MLGLFHEQMLGGVCVCVFQNVVLTSKCITFVLTFDVYLECVLLDAWTNQYRWSIRIRLQQLRLDIMPIAGC